MRVKLNESKRRKALAPISSYEPAVNMSVMNKALLLFTIFPPISPSIQHVHILVWPNHSLPPCSTPSASETNRMKNSFFPSQAKEKSHRIHLHKILSEFFIFFLLYKWGRKWFINLTWQEESSYNPLKADTGTPHIPIKVAYFLCETGVSVFVAG